MHMHVLRCSWQQARQKRLSCKQFEVFPPIWEVEGSIKYELHTMAIHIRGITEWFGAAKDDLAGTAISVPPAPTRSAAYVIIQA